MSYSIDEGIKEVDQHARFLARALQERLCTSFALSSRVDTDLT